VAAKALERHRLPPRHLEPVLQTSVRHGHTKGMRGPHGGYELVRKRRHITADDIPRAASIIEDNNEPPPPGSALVTRMCCRR
jgi:DNA-binding IscR family transcriptional regulator